MLPRRAIGGQKVFFITLGGPQAHDSSGREDNFSWALASLKKI
jgi:hypothetical protein